jgi:hypothetical protein
VTDSTDELAEVIEQTREGAVRSAKQIQKLLQKMEKRLDGLTKGKGTPRELQQAMTAYGIMIDKVPVVLRTLRSLEAESNDDIAAGWTVVVKEDE